MKYTMTVFTAAGNIQNDIEETTEAEYEDLKNAIKEVLLKDKGYITVHYLGNETIVPTRNICGVRFTIYKDQS